MNDDRLLAAVEAIGRAGARGFEFGYLDDDVPVEEARWWAAAHWGGVRVQVDEHTGPGEAAEALARQVLERSGCVRCGLTITLEGGGPGRCRWYRVGPHWLRGCDNDHRPLQRLNRAQRRRQAETRRLRGR